MSLFTAIQGSSKPSGVAPITFVQQKVGSTADGMAGLTVNFDTPLSAGQSVIALVTGAEVPVTVVTVGGGEASAGMVVGIDGAGHTLQGGIYVLHNAEGGETGLSILTTSPIRVSANVSVWENLADAAAESSNATTGTSISPATPTITPTSPANLIIAMFAFTADDYSSGAAGFTALTNTGGDAAWQAAAYKIQESADAQTPEIDLEGVLDWAAAGAAFGGS